MLGRTIASPGTILSSIGPDWLITWLTPVWILGVGATFGLAILLVLWGLLFLVSRRGAMNIPELIGEGAMLPIFVVTAVFAVFGVVGAVIVRSPGDMLASIPRFLATGPQKLVLDVPITDAETFFEAEVKFTGMELSQFRVESDQPIFVGKTSDDQTTDNMIEVEPGNSYEWNRGAESISPFGDGLVTRLSISNLGSTNAEVTFNLETKPVFPQTRTVVLTAVCVVLFFLLYFLQQWLFPKVSAIALTTAKSELAQPMFLIILGFGAFLLFIFLYIPYNTFGEDIKMLKDSGFTTIMILAIIQAVWAASNSVAEEIDGKTALTVLSKPVSRRQFIFGKFLGIIWSVAVIFIVLGAFFLVLVAYKPVYDARESSKLPPIWEECYIEVVRTVPGLVLAFLETVVLTAISVAISTRLPLLPNFSICFVVYALGHLTPLIVQSSVGSLPPVAFMGSFIATVLPMLEAFNIQAAVAAGREVPHSYLLYALAYCVLYSAVAMLLALILFEDRDLA
ncbi:MAG: ABC transporter permease [Gammaproteobacteria bacterium]|nr:ABC transporter permease [Gammaproteobacteria bacterium]